MKKYALITLLGYVGFISASDNGQRCKAASSWSTCENQSYYGYSTDYFQPKRTKVEVLYDFNQQQTAQKVARLVAIFQKRQEEAAQLAAQCQNNQQLSYEQKNQQEDARLAAIYNKNETDRKEKYAREKGWA